MGFERLGKNNFIWKKINRRKYFKQLYSIVVVIVFFWFLKRISVQCFFKGNRNDYVILCGSGGGGGVYFFFDFQF